MFEASNVDFKNALRDKLKSIKTASAALKDRSIENIYLAETNHDLEKQRESIKLQLMEQGYKVLPEHTLPLVYEELIETIDNLLDQCEISIHLLGEDYGFVPDKTGKSVICWQYERAAEISPKGQLQRLVRLSPTINQTDERQQSFIQSVKANANLFPNDDIFETSIEEMESTIFRKLEIIEEKKRKKREEKKASTITEPIEGPQQIYLICDQRDFDNITEMEDFLYQSEFDVILPVFEGEEKELMTDHREYLKSCDAVIIYYGSGNELWIRSKNRDLTKIAGYGRTSPLNVKAVFLAPPVTRAKEHFRFHEWLIINGMEGFSSELMEPFTDILNLIGK